MLRPQLLICILLTFCMSCKSISELTELEWVLGKWQVNESRSYEEWEKVNKDLYRGKGYKVRKNDTLITETIDLVKRGDAIFYIPSVSDQNEGKPVEFKLISKKEEELIFENKEHDFPQRIIYIKTSDSLIDARIEGIKQGFFSEVKFKLNKVNSSINP